MDDSLSGGEIFGIFLLVCLIIACTGYAVLKRRTLKPIVQARVTQAKGVAQSHLYARKGKASAGQAPLSSAEIYTDNEPIIQESTQDSDDRQAPARPPVPRSAPARPPQPAVVGATETNSDFEDVKVRDGLPPPVCPAAFSTVCHAGLPTSSCAFLRHKFDRVGWWLLLCLCLVCVQLEPARPPPPVSASQPKVAPPRPTLAPAPVVPNRPSAQDKASLYKVCQLFRHIS